jgi:hypothetical protein
LLSGCSRRAGAVAGTATVTGALAQPKTAEAPDASHGHDSGEGHGAKLSAAQQDEVITAIEQRQASEFTYPSAHPHPHHGRHVRRPDLWRQQGLRRWKLVGFRGAQSFFTAAGMKASRRPHAGHSPASRPGQEHVAGMSHGNRKD